jgi:hypothetical protein
MNREQLKEIIINTHEGDMNTLKKKMLSIVDVFIGELNAINTQLEAAVTIGGSGTAAAIAAIEEPKTNALYRVITTGGNLNSGGTQITVAVNDVVYHDGTKWVLLVDADTL